MLRLRVRTQAAGEVPQGGAVRTGEGAQNKQRTRNRHVLCGFGRQAGAARGTDYMLLMELWAFLTLSTWIELLAASTVAVTLTWSP